LEPDKERDRGGELDRNHGENSVAGALADNLNGRALAGQSDQDADPVWTWNAPMSLTGDDGSGDSRSSKDCRGVTERDRLLTEKMLARVTLPNARRRLKEKVANVRAYFGSKEQFERAKGGRTHYA